MCVVAAIRPVFSYVERSQGYVSPVPHLHSGNPKPYLPISCTRGLRTESSIAALCAQSAPSADLARLERHSLLLLGGLGACFCRSSLLSELGYSLVRTHTRVLHSYADLQALCLMFLPSEQPNSRWGRHLVNRRRSASIRALQDPPPPPPSLDADQRESIRRPYQLSHALYIAK